MNIFYRYWKVLGRRPSQEPLTSTKYSVGYCIYLGQDVNGDNYLMTTPNGEPFIPTIKYQKWSEPDDNCKSILDKVLKKITPSMQKAIDEADRRRAKQIAHNEEHGITPKSAKCQITDKIETGEILDDSEKNRAIPVQSGEQMDKLPDVDIEILRSPDLLAKEINRLEKEMKALSKDLKFEEAASVRDKVLELKDWVIQ